MPLDAYRDKNVREKMAALQEGIKVDLKIKKGF